MMCEKKRHHCRRRYAYIQMIRFKVVSLVIYEIGKEREKNDDDAVKII